MLGDSLDAVQSLIDAGADVNHLKKNGETPLLTAARHDREAIAKHLMEKGAKLDVSTDLGTAVSVAAGEGSPGVLQALLDAGADPNVVSSHNMTPMIMAAAAGHAECVSSLLRHNASVLHVGPHGLTALHFLAERGMAEQVAATLEAAQRETNPDGNATTTTTEWLCQHENEDQMKPIHLAAGLHHRDVVEMLFPHSGLEASLTIDTLIAQQKERVAHESKGAKGAAAPVEDAGDAFGREGMSHCETLMGLVPAARGHIRTCRAMRTVRRDGLNPLYIIRIHAHCVLVCWCVCVLCSVPYADRELPAEASASAKEAAEAAKGEYVTAWQIRSPP